jgi:AcrR family transcriptional regulator
MATRDTIVEAACSCLASTGLSRLTIAAVARTARVSTALVHYHFATKRRLLTAAATALARRRADGRVAGLTGAPGLAALDALWATIGVGAERTAADLVLLGRQDGDARAALLAERRREQSRIAAALPRCLAGLGARPGIPPEDLAGLVCIFLDGAAVALAAGTPPADVRASYDAFWLALVALGQTATGR